MKRCTVLFTACLIFVASASTARAQTYLYWDTNGATAGSTNTPPDAPGTWDGATTNWSTAADGGVATQAWTPNSDAVFSAGTDASGTYNVTLSGTQSANSVTFQDGAVTVAGGTELTLTGARRVSVGGMAGDYNNNGFVDAADYVVWLNAGPTDTLPNDVTPGTVTAADYTFWRSNFGNELGGPATTATINSVIGGTVGLNKTGAGTLQLGGANTYSGNTSLSAYGGKLKIGATNSLPITTVVTMPTVANGNARLELFDASNNFFNQTIAGLSGGAGGTVATSAVVDVGFSTLTLDIPAGPALAYSGFLKTDYNIFDDTHGYVIKNGAGQINLQANNGSAPFAGEFILNAGTVGIGNNQAFGQVTSTNRLTINGGKLSNTTNPNTSLNLAVRNTDIAGSFEFDANGVSNSQFIGNAGNAFVTLKASNPTITVNPDPTRPVISDPITPTNLSGVVIFAALVRDDPLTPGTPRGFTKAGDGILTLSTPTNSYTGETTILDGILRLSKTTGAALPSGDGRPGDPTAATNRVNLSGGTLNYNGSVIANFDVSRTLTMANRMRVTADSTISYHSTTLNLVPPVPAGLTDFHNIYFVFTHNEIDRTGGTLTFQNDGVCTSNGNTCTFRPTFTGNFDYTGPVVVNDQITDAPTGRLSSRGTVLQSTNTSGTQTWSGIISGTGDFLRGGTGGTTILSGNNTYTGNTIVTAGTLSITNAYLADAADVLMTTGGIFDLNFAGTDTIDQLFFDGLPQAIGTWGSSGSTATNINDTFFNPLSAGTLTVTAAGAGGGGDSLTAGGVPEPGSLMLALVAGSGMVGFGRRSRRRQA